MTNAGWKCFGAVAIGLVLAQLISRLTEYYTGTEHAPVQEIAESSETGPATVVLSGTVERPGELGVRRHRHRHRHRRGARPRRRQPQFSLYLVALTGMGMLATTGVIVSEDTFGPVSDNAAGIAEMSGEFHGEPERIMVSLDAVGNTTKAVTKGFAIGSAVIAAVALFASFIETAGNELARRQPHRPAARDGSRHLRRHQPADQRRRPEDLHRPAASAAPCRSCSRPSPSAPSAERPASSCSEVRSQFADGQIMAGTKEPDYGPVIDICTAASLRELATPALLAVLTPVIIGFGIGWQALGGFLAAVILVGQLMAELPVATPAAPGTTPRSTSRTATTAARAPTPTRRRSSATPSATRSRTPPARRSTR